MQAMPIATPLYARGGIAAAAHPFVVEAALEVMRDGGNAIDAAIAGSSIMMCVDPNNSHLGADAFCIVHLANGSVHAFGGAGSAGTHATLYYFRERGGFPDAGLPLATVPGVVAVWDALKQFGRKPLAPLLRRAIDYARDGIPVTPHLHHTFSEDSNQILGRFPETAKTYRPGGEIPHIGTMFAQPSLSKGLERVAAGGAEDFYRGSIAREIVAFSKANGGLFELDDFANYKANVASPISVTYRGYTVYENHPVSPGIVTLLALKILERFDLHKHAPDSPGRFHLLGEAVKLAFADRSKLGDPAFVDNNLEHLLSETYADQQAARIDLKRARITAPVSVAMPGTDSAVFGDAEGNVVTLIQSTYHSCGHIAGDTGVLLNSRMVGFSLDPSSPNVVAPGKQPMHTLNTYVVHDDAGRFVLAGGTPGGNFQVQTNLQMITNILDYGMSLTEAEQFPRFKIGERRGEMNDPLFRIESRVPEATIDELRKAGHRAEVMGPWEHDGAVKVITRDHRTGVYRGATETRRPDCSIGGI